jgi:hypothetical protein
MNLCLCGCGGYVSNCNNKYIQGHNLREEKIQVKRNIGIKKSWCNEKRRQLASDLMTTLWQDEKYINKQKEGMNKSEIKEKLSKAAKKRMSDITIKNKMISTMKTKFSDYNFRLFISKRTKEGMLNKGYTSEVISRLTKEGMKGLDLSGENSASWKGGLSFQGYCKTWNDCEFKQYIFERDSYKCQNIYCHHTSTRLSRHHIDYNKKNCDPNNVITLCNSCNARANKNRKYWKRFYKRIMKYNK